MERDVVVCGPYRMVSAAGYTGQGVLGVTPPTASVGFAHAIERDVVADIDPGLRIPAIGVIVHSARLCDGHPKFPPSDAKIAETKGAVPGSEVIDDLKVSGVVSFVFAVDFVGDRYDRADRLASLVQALPRLLTGRRYAGASIFREPDFSCSGVLSPSDQRAALGKMRRGYMLRDRRDILEAAVLAGKDELQAILDAAAFERPAKGGATTKVTPGATAPITVGYRAIEPPRMRGTARKPEPALHAFADSLTSIGEWIFTRRLAVTHEGPAFQGVLWSPWADQELGLFYASATETPATQGSLRCAVN